MKQLAFDFPIPDGYTVIFRAWITQKNGKRLHAKTVGIRGFPIIVKTDK